MAAYAALVSLNYIIHQIEHHPSPPISLQKQQVESLTEKVNFLQEFLESYVSPFSYSDAADPLEMQIADAAYAVEDVIESHIVDTIHHSTSSTIKDDGGETSSIDFCKSLQKVIEDMGLIVKELTEIGSEKAADEHQMQSHVASYGSRRSEMVGFDDVFLQLLDRLTGRNLNRQIIPITGMGGIGKTTLARNAFENTFIKEHFDVCLWATISQDCNIGQTLREVVSQAREHLSCEKSGNELGEALYKYLYGRRYLVVMDDMWSVEVWDKMKFSFPNNNNGSRVIVTTRLSNLAVHLTDSDSLLDMRFLDEVSSWNLFSKTVFGDECFPSELEGVGKQIVENCKGLPLAIVVIGGLLAKSQHTQGYWKYVEKNLNSIVNSENDGHCSRVLRLSYNHLPAHLKPCFLYMGVFEEDRSIMVSRLIKLWVSEGFLKPKSSESLETVAKEYLNELVARNLIMVDKLGSLGKIKYCKIHDLLRDLSLKEAEKQRFCYVLKEDSPPDIYRRRRIVVPITTSEKEVISASKSMLSARSYVCYERVKPLPDFRLLRTFQNHDSILMYSRYEYDLEHVFGLVNSRYLSVCTGHVSGVPSSINLLWNLHTLIICCPNELTAPIQIWNMHQLKHVKFEYEGFYLPDPPYNDDNDIVVMENLQTLTGVNNFNLNGEVARRIPNIRKLYIHYKGQAIDRVNCVSYFHCLSKLESLKCSTDMDGRDEYLEEISFPRTLKKLTIWAAVELEHILPKIGSLPLLHTLEFRGGLFRTGKWETVEGQFPSLKSLTLGRACYLELSEHGDLEKWTMPDGPSCFPLLEQLILKGFTKLEEIPQEIGEIPTLKSIQLICCGESAVLSAKRIIQEQEDLHGEELDLHVEVECKTKEEIQALQYLATPSFRVSLKSFSYWYPIHVEEPLIAESHKLIESIEIEDADTFADDDNGSAQLELESVPDS